MVRKAGQNGSSRQLLDKTVWICPTILSLYAVTANEPLIFHCIWLWCDADLRGKIDKQDLGVGETYSPDRNGSQ